LKAFDLIQQPKLKNNLICKGFFMNKISAGVFSLSIALTSFAMAQSSTQFDCTTTKTIEGQKPSQFSFSVLNLETGRAEYQADSGAEDAPVKMTPEDSVLDLNENFTIGSGSRGLRLTSDGDGCQFTEVLLYKDRGYKSGYVKIEDGGCGAEGVPAYSTVSCKVKSLK
jgi:hypothetical protein